MKKPFKKLLTGTNRGRYPLQICFSSPGTIYQCNTRVGRTKINTLIFRHTMRNRFWCSLLYQIINVTFVMQRLHILQIKTCLYWSIAAVMPTQIVCLPMTKHSRVKISLIWIRDQMLNQWHHFRYWEGEKYFTSPPLPIIWDEQMLRTLF